MFVHDNTRNLHEQISSNLILIFFYLQFKKKEPQQGQRPHYGQLFTNLEQTNRNS